MAITPYYRERSSGYPNEAGELLTGQNFEEWVLYALRTRIEADPIYSEFSNRYGTVLGFRNRSQNDRICIEIVIRRVGEPDPENSYQTVQSLDPEWLQPLVDKWIGRHQEYAVILTDQYEVKGVPAWWLAEIMPRIDITSLIQEVWFENDQRHAEDYDYFYENGSIYIRLINPNEDNTGPYTPKSDDTLKTGDRAIKRGEASYGDHSDYHIRYVDLHTALYYHLIDMYNRGVVCLPSTSSIIELWGLSAVDEAINLYEPRWRDVRLTHYDGATNLLQRQFPEYSKQWNYKHVYLHVGNNRVLKHLVAAEYYKVTGEIAIYYDTLLSIKVSSLKEAQTFANQIDLFKDTVSGSVVPKGFVEGKTGNIFSVFYFEMANMNLIESRASDITLQIVPSTIRPRDVKKYIAEALGKMENIPKAISPRKTGPTMTERVKTPGRSPRRAIAVV